MGSLKWSYKEGLGFRGLGFRVTVIITHIRRLVTPLITTHEPPSMLVRLLQPQT